jgi:hypothetical protein
MDERMIENTKLDVMRRDERRKKCNKMDKKYPRDENLKVKKLFE